VAAPLSESSVRISRGVATECHPYNRIRACRWPNRTSAAVQCGNEIHSAGGERKVGERNSQSGKRRNAAGTKFTVWEAPERCGNEIHKCGNENHGAGTKFTAREPVKKRAGTKLPMRERNYQCGNEIPNAGTIFTMREAVRATAERNSRCGEHPYNYGSEV